MESITKNYDKDIKAHLVEYFKVVKTYSEKYNIVFLSKRFQLVYYSLKAEYPGIDFSVNTLHNKTMYINDINYELPKKIDKSDLICTFAYVHHFRTLGDQSYPIPWSLEDLQLAGDKELFVPKKYNRKLHVQLKGFWHTMMSVALDFFAKEVNLLYENNVSNALELLPDFLQNYFTFWADNQEPLEYFLVNFYARRSMEDINSDEERIELKERLIKEIIEKFGRENLSTEFLAWLDSTGTGNLYMCHTSVNHKLVCDSEIKTLELTNSYHEKN